MGGVFAGILIAVLAGGSAAVAGPTNHDAAVQVLTAPPAPSNAGAANLRTAAAASPGISPSVRTIHVSPPGSFNCDPGNLCAWVWDPTTSDFKVFFLFACNRYSLSNWFGDGGYADNQTGGVRSTFYGQSGNVLTSFTPDFPATHGYNWDRVWSIRNC
jgi:hypothetical protein